jgi:phage host-nuclease inhibitor protein Gam
MAKRIKSKKQIIPIKDWEEADKYIKNIGDCQLEINRLEAEANDSINQAKEKLAKAVEAPLKEIKIFSDSLEAFAANHVHDFGKAQSKKLNFGLLGWRKSTSISIKKSTLKLIKKVFGKKAEQYIRTKEEPNKEAMAALTDQQLASVDARRKPKEVFFVEPDTPKSVDYDETQSI